MSESAIQRAMLVALNSKPGIRAFRNQVGKYRTDDGRWISSGLCVGSSDLIGWAKVGKTAVFLAVEVKAPGKKPTDDQLNFLRMVDFHGGIGIVADSVESLERQLTTAICIQAERITGGHT